MKKTNYLVLLIILAFISLRSYPQEQEKELSTSKHLDSLNLRILRLETAINEQKLAQQEAEKSSKKQSEEALRNQFNNSIIAIRTGLEMGSEIELILPSTLRLLALKELNETLNAINNPTSISVGQAFSDMVIESAAQHLLPKFPNEEISKQAKEKFKNVLTSIYKGPLVQSLINSNPISSTINAAIQQAGFFEKNREIPIEISRNQIKRISKNTPLTLSVNTTNFDGTSFGHKEMDDFNKDLEKRIEFYSEMNQYSISQSIITQQLYIDAKVINKSIKASKSEICKLLEINVNNSSESLSLKFDSLNIEEIKALLKKENFKKAISLSDYAKEQLPEVKYFSLSVINELVKSIDGYIGILNKHKDIPDAKLDKTEIDKQIIKLESIKSSLKNPKII